MTEPQTLYLVDGSSYLYRAFFAPVGARLSTSDGKPTGAIYIVGNMIKAWLKEHNPTHIAVVFDAPGKTFRHDMFEEYKATRPPMPDELREQVAPLLEMIEAFGLPLLRVPDVEADDVIGTLCRQAVDGGMNVVVSTSDKDLAQLVDDHVTLVNTMDKTTLDEAGVEKKFGVPPNRIIDYLALVGDKSDNVPGVHKCGPKTAAKWLGLYGDLDGVISHADDVGGKIGEYLREALDTLPLSRDLVTIKTDVGLEQGPADLTLGEQDRDKLVELFSRFEFNSWLAELDEEPEEDQPEARYETVRTEAALNDWIDRLRAADCFALDTETTSLDPMRADLVGVSFACEPGHAAYVPIAHTAPESGEQLPLETVIQAIRPLLEDPQCKVVGQHFKYDAIVLSRYGIELSGWRFDTMLESYVYNASGFRHDMDSLAANYLGRKTIHYEDIAGKGAKQITFDEVPVEQAAQYAAEDADITLQLHEKLWPEVSAEPKLKKVFEEIEMPLAPVLARMERRGVLVDQGLLKQLSDEFAHRMFELETEAHDIAGRKFNLGSTKQLQQLLFEEQGLPVIRKTPKGQPSTAEDVLEQLASDYPLPRIIMEHRQLSKLKSTYTDALPHQINPDTGRIHTSYHQAVAATGRLSSNDPNLQNIPIRTAEGRRIREAFVVPEGFVMLAADYSQIELRIMAHLSGDEGLMTAFREGLDIHAATAAEVFGGTPETVSSETRRSAKAINFGLIYGMSAFGLARQLGIERREAQEYIDLYFARYPGVKRYMEDTRAKAHDLGYVETLFGRRLTLPEINARNFQRRQASERAAINAPMQGTAADIIKRAMIEADRWLTETFEDNAVMLMQVHDELVLEVRQDLLDDVSSGIQQLMGDAAELAVPLLVDAGSGSNWNEAH
ncbi:MAG: DNA polymerase I [Xanthomonadales bacterium]|nr:DNA polymerase I [Xanthomonadales bacterium]